MNFSFFRLQKVHPPLQHGTPLEMLASGPQQGLGECSQSLLELYVESLEEPAGADGVEPKLELELS